MADIKPYERLVEYYETDKMGIVHHANYLHWFEEARTHYMAQNGLDYKDIEEMGIMMPVLGISCNYKHSTQYRRVAVVNVKVLKFNGIKLTYGYEVTDKESGVLLVTGTSEHCFVDNDFKPINLKKSYKSIYDTIISNME